MSTSPDIEQNHRTNTRLKISYNNFFTEQMGAYKHAKTGCSILPLLPPFTSGQHLCRRERPRAGEAHPYSTSAPKSPPQTKPCWQLPATPCFTTSTGAVASGARLPSPPPPLRGARPRRETLRLRAGGNDSAAREATARPGRARPQGRSWPGPPLRCQRSQGLPPPPHSPVP